MKIKRQSKILELIKNNNIDTQEKLVESLNNEGFNVTQATVSRDIRELRLTKVSTADGGVKYAEFTQDGPKITERLIRVFKEGVLSIDYANNILVIKTLNGMAMAVAAALDSMENTEIMGTIAGDDTIFCVVKSEEKAVKIVDKLKQDTIK